MAVKRKLTKAAEHILTLYDVFKDFVELKESLNKSPKTIKNYSESFEKWVKYLEDKEFSMNVKDLDSSYIFSFRTHYLREGEMKPVSLNHYLRDIKTFCNYVFERGLAEPFKIDLVAEQQEVIETYSDDDLIKLLARPSKMASFVEWRSWAVVNWMLATGHRAATVCAVTIGDINFKSREIVVNRSKSKKALVLPMSSALSTALTDYVRKWRADSSPKDYLFPNIGDEALTVNALKLSIRKYNRDRDVKMTSLHAFRHTFAKMWIKNTGNVFMLQKILMHSRLEMTRRYVELFDEDLKEGFDGYNPLDKLKKATNRTNKMKRNDED